jgi:CHAD domain-containing protein
MGNENPSDPDVRSVALSVLRERSAAMERLWAGAVEGTDPESLHDLRVNARRVQAALRLFREALPKRSRRQSAEIKRLIRYMGQTRELDVFLESVREAMQRATGDRRALEWLAAHVESERAECQRKLARTLQSSDWSSSFRRFLSDLR